jgi:hypothetical protein
MPYDAPVSLSSACPTREETPTSPENALEVLLSHLPLKLETQVSHCPRSRGLYVRTVFLC